MTDETTKLKPCPFCGSPAKLLGGPMAQETYSIWCTNPKGKRHHMSGTMDASKTISEWNTRAAPKVKPLVWTKEREHDSTEYVETEFGTYVIWESSFSDDSGHCRLPDGQGGRQVGGDKEKARSVAQADYERRILSALEQS